MGMLEDAGLQTVWVQGQQTHCDSEAAGNRWMWGSDSSSMSSAKLAFLWRASWECTSRKPGVLLTVCTHTGIEPSALPLTRPSDYNSSRSCSGPGIFIQKSDEKQDRYDIIWQVFKTMIFTAEKRLPSLPDLTYFFYLKLQLEPR